MLLGGRSAEEIAFNEISTGAQNDLMRATDIARAMVTEFGMSDALGVVNYDGHRQPAFIENPFGRERGNYAEETALQIDIEIKRILTAAHEKARQILRDHRETLDRLSERLLEKEVIEADELKAIMGAVPAEGSRRHAGRDSAGRLDAAIAVPRLPAPSPLRPSRVQSRTFLRVRPAFPFSRPVS